MARARAYCRDLNTNLLEQITRPMLGGLTQLVDLCVAQLPCPRNFMRVFTHSSTRQTPRAQPTPVKYTGWCILEQYDAGARVSKHLFAALALCPVYVNAHAFAFI